MQPILEIYTKKYADNVNYLLSILHRQNLSVMAVSKVFCASQPLIDVLNASSVAYIADSRMQNLKAMKTDKPKVLLRIPSPQEADEAVKVCDMTLQSELAVILAFNLAAKRQDKIHNILLMFDVGDLREGIYYTENYISIVEEIKNLSHINLAGIGTNLTCFGGVIPTKETLQKLIIIQKDIEAILGKRLSIISGGNSSSIELMFNRHHPKAINNLRIGEAFVLGRETAYGHAIDNMYDDVFVLKAAVVEAKTKPSMPEGLLGMDAFGKPVSFQDEGIQRRIIIALGRQDVDCFDLIPPKGIRVLGCSSDHLVAVTDDQTIQVGDIITFKLTYGGILRAMTSDYVKKTYV